MSAYQYVIPARSLPPKGLTAGSTNTRQHVSEYLDDVIFQCGALRCAADRIQSAAAKLDKARREGKAWDSGAIMRELTKAEEALRTAFVYAEAMTK